MLYKLLLIIGLVAIVYFIFFKKKSLGHDTKKDKQDASDMIACSTCGIYSQIDDSLLSNGKYFCSKECQAKAS